MEASTGPRINGVLETVLYVDDMARGIAFYRDVLGLRPMKGDRLSAAGVVIESVGQWERGGRSMYFRDPDGHLLEFITPGIWPNY